MTKAHPHKKEIASPPSESVKSIQHDLFSEFVTNDLSEVSNAVEYWERIPKYFLTSGQQKKLRNSDGLATPYKYDYTLKDREGRILPYKVEIQPALIEQSDGKYKAFFPTKAEENIEEVLKKVFTDQQYGIHETEKSRSWVKFSYGMVKRELKDKKCGRTFKEIKHSLSVMSKCILTLYENGNEIYTGAILENYISVDREKYLGNTDSLHVARLPLFITEAINRLEYRQYNYKKFMRLKEQLTGWLYKRLIDRFTYASFTSTHNFFYSEIKQASGLLQQKRETDNRKKIISSLDELKISGVVLTYEVEEKKQGNKVVDVKYTVTPHSDFIKEQKASNKRDNIKTVTAKQKGLNVDKSKLK